MPSLHWLPGLQLSTLGNAPKQDLQGTLRQVAAIGYQAVEFPGHYDRSGSQLRSALDAAGLTCPSIHAAFRPLPGLWDLEGDLAKVADDINAIGASHVVVGGPWLPDRVWRVVHKSMMGEPQPELFEAFGSLSADDWKRTADLLNEKGAILARSGLHLAYHNHDVEFLSGGKTGWDILLERTDPQIAAFELDIGWAASAGMQPADLLEQLGRRIMLIQLKDIQRASIDVLRLASTDIGTGIIDWEKLVPLVRRTGIRHLFVEQDPPFANSPMNSARVAYRFLCDAFARAR